MASPVWLDRYEYRIDRCEGFGIVKLEDPPFLARVVFVEDSQTERLLLIRATPPPRLERTGIFQTCFLVEVIGIENERLPFGVENAAVCLVRLLRFLPRRAPRRYTGRARPSIPGCRGHDPAIPVVSRSAACCWSSACSRSRTRCVNSSTLASKSAACFAAASRCWLSASAFA